MEIDLDFSYETWIQINWNGKDSETGRLTILGGAGTKLIIINKDKGKEHFLELMSKLYDDSIIERE